jgi:hypothetical protein
MNQVEIVNKAIKGLQEAKKLGPDGPNTPTNWVFSCPIPQKHQGRTRQRTPPFGINRISGAWHCYSCGVGGTTIQFLWARMFGIDLKAAGDAIGVPVVENEDLRRKLASGNNSGNWPVCLEPVPRTIPIMDAPEALAFLWDRYRIGPEQAVASKMTFCPDKRITLQATDETGRHKSVGGCRIVYPVTFAGKAVGWSSRSILPDAEPKYFRPVIGIGIVFFDPAGLFTAGPPKRVFLVEGDMDTYASLRDGLPTVGCNSANLTNEQAARLAAVEEVVFLYDNDDAGRKGVARAIHDHGLFMRYKVAWVRSLNRKGEPAKDPGEAVEGFGRDVLAQIQGSSTVSGADLRSRLGQ